MNDAYIDGNSLTSLSPLANELVTDSDAVITSINECISSASSLTKVEIGSITGPLQTAKTNQTDCKKSENEILESCNRIIKTFNELFNGELDSSSFNYSDILNSIENRSLSSEKFLDLTTKVISGVLSVSDGSLTKVLSNMGYNDSEIKIIKDSIQLNVNENFSNNTTNINSVKNYVKIPIITRESDNGPQVKTTSYNPVSDNPASGIFLDLTTKVIQGKLKVNDGSLTQELSNMGYSISEIEIIKDSIQSNVNQNYLNNTLSKENVKNYVEIPSIIRNSSINVKEETIKVNPVSKETTTNKTISTSASKNINTINVKSSTVSSNTSTINNKTTSASKNTNTINVKSSPSTTTTTVNNKTSSSNKNIDTINVKSSTTSNTTTDTNKNILNLTPEQKKKQVMEKYNLNEDQYATMIATIQYEGVTTIDHSSEEIYKEAANVTSTILNRANSERYKDYGGDNPYSQLTYSGQFSAYGDGVYREYLNNYSPVVEEAVCNTLLTGDATHGYTSYRGQGINAGERFIDGGNSYFI